jgi:hypothetical protein
MIFNPINLKINWVVFLSGSWNETIYWALALNHQDTLYNFEVFDILEFY